MRRRPLRSTPRLALGAGPAALLWAAACAGAPPPAPAEPESVDVEEESPFYSRGAASLEAEDSASGMVRVSDPINPRDGSPYRTYRLELGEGDVVHVEARSTAFAPTVSILGPDGTLVGASDAGQSGAGSSSLVRRIPAAGVYFLVVSSEGSGKYGAFDLATKLLDPDKSVSIPGSVEGFLYSGGRAHPKTEAPMRVYPIETEETTPLDINLRSHDFDTYLTLVEAGSDRVLGENDDAGGGTNARVIAELPAGSYEIWASALRPEGAEGQYNLNVAEAEIDRSESFSLGRMYKGFLGLDRQAVPGTPRTGQPLEFEVDEAMILRATMSSESLDSFLVLTDAGGRSLAQDDDSGGERDARLLHPLEPGRYVLWASSYNANEGGPFRVESSLLEGSDETSISVGASIDAVLTQGDEVYTPRGSHVRYYDLEIERPTKVGIDLSSQDFDVYLVLEDDMGNLLDENDDAAGGSTDAQITRRLEPGTYRIGATSYPPSGSGAFTLRVSSR